MVLVGAVQTIRINNMMCWLHYLVAKELLGIADHEAQHMLMYFNSSIVEMPHTAVNDWQQHNVP